MTLHCRGHIYFCFTAWSWVSLLFLMPLAVSAQQKNDTVVVSGPKPDTIVSIGASNDTGMATSGQYSGSDTLTGAAGDSALLEQSGTKAGPALMRNVPDSVVNEWKKEKDFAYANDPAYWRREQPAENHSNRFLRWLAKVLASQGFKYFILALLAAILLFAIIRIISENNLRLFYRPPKKGVQGAEEVVSPLEVDPDIQLEHALASRDHRLAVRWLYLKTLRLLNDRALIKYTFQSTNREYAQQLSGSLLGGPFRFLTGAYEKVWYGEFSLSDGQFEKLYPYFQEFYKSIPSP
jgi:Domain of unknown function (DUF4129)